MNGKVILDLCGGTGSWSEPYRKAGYEVINVTLPEYDVRTFEPPDQVHGILAAPPCTEFAVSGARHWARKDQDKPELLWEALEVVIACMVLVEKSKERGLKWWAMENPVGRLKQFIGKYRYTFQPYEYGDPWLKRTCIWGEHHMPRKNPVPIAEIATRGFEQRSGGYKNRNTAFNAAANSRHNNPGEFMHELVIGGHIPADWIHRLPPSADRQMLRSITPPGWAKAFFEANP